MEIADEIEHAPTTTLTKNSKVEGKKTAEPHLPAES